jgi:hypothetical protein
MENAMLHRVAGLGRNISQHLPYDENNSPKSHNLPVSSSLLLLLVIDSLLSHFLLLWGFCLYLSTLDFSKFENIFFDWR